MKPPAILSCCFLTLLFAALAANAQDDEARRSSGLPISVGENASNSSKAALSGKLTVQGLNESTAKPTFFVIVYFNGVPVDKRQVNDAGYFYVPAVPRQGAILSVEMDGVEIGRYQLPVSATGNIRQDLVINWAQVQNTKTKAGIINVRDFYHRTDENEKMFEKARLASKGKKTDEAVNILKQIVKNDPKDFVAWTELGTLFFLDQKFSEAEEAYNKALEQKPDFMVALLNSGKLFLAQKQTDKAITVLSKAVEVEPGSADAQHYLGEAYLQAKKGSKAVIYLNEAIRLAPVEKAEIHLRLAALYNAAGLKDKAVEEYKLFLEKIPKYPERDKIEKYIKENSPK